MDRLQNKKHKLHIFTDKYLKNNIYKRVLDLTSTLNFYSCISLANFPIALVSIRET